MLLVFPNIALSEQWKHREWSHSVYHLGVCVLNCIQLSEAPWTAAHQAPLSTGFPRLEYWSGLPYPSPEELPKPGIEPESSTLARGFLYHSQWSHWSPTSLEQRKWKHTSLQRHCLYCIVSPLSTHQYPLSGFNQRLRNNRRCILWD